MHDNLHHVYHMHVKVFYRSYTHKYSLGKHCESIIQ